MHPDLHRREDCRLCAARDLDKVIELAWTPPANELLAGDQLELTQDTFPLDVYFCNSCYHVQLLDVVNPERLFRNYVYVSGTSPVFRQHFRDYAERIAERYDISRQSLVVDIGSNDGTLLKCFKDLGFERIQGVDPAIEIAEEAARSGIPTIAEFFTPELADRLATRAGTAGLIVANNVFAHVDDLSTIMVGVQRLLSNRGLLVIEVSYLKDVIEKTLFDTIYHEHLDYHTLGPLKQFLESRGLRVVDAQAVASHGGSLRLVAMKNGEDEDVQPSVERMVEREAELGLFDAATFVAFQDKIDALGKQLLALLDEVKARGASIAAFGFPAKATTLMHQFGIDGRYLDYVVDDNPLKQSKYSPGFKIPIVSSAALEADPPAYVVVLAWNFADAIIEKLDWYLGTGGNIIVPLPSVRVVEGA